MQRRSTANRMVVLAFLGLACANEDVEAAADLSAASDAVALQCDGLTADECKKREGCVAIQGVAPAVAPVCGGPCCGPAPPGFFTYLACVPTADCTYSTDDQCVTPPGEDQAIVLYGWAPKAWDTVKGEAAKESCCGPRLCVSDPGRLCILGNGWLEVGHVIHVSTRPKGCFAEDCWALEESGCALDSEGPDVVVQAQFCLRDRSKLKSACSSGCEAAGSASCTGAGMWTAGTHTVRWGELAISVTVPMGIPLGGLCTGTTL